MADDLQAENPYAAPEGAKSETQTRSRISWRINVWNVFFGVLGMGMIKEAIVIWTSDDATRMKPPGDSYGALEFILGALLVSGAGLRFFGIRAGKWLIIASFVILGLFCLNIFLWFAFFGMS